MLGFDDLRSYDVSSSVDCIDCAAEASVVNAVNDGIEAARAIIPIRRPWVMVSVNDDEDFHFRKAGSLCSLIMDSSLNTFVLVLPHSFAD